MDNRTVPSILLWAAAVALAGCGAPTPGVKIGFVAPLTGDQASHGADMLHGAELAIAEAAADGPVFPGARVELIPLDDQHSPAQAVAMAKKLAADPAVMAVVGHLNSSCTKPASAIYHKARLLHLNPVSSNPDISRQGFDTFFRICATDDLQGPAAARFAWQTLGSRRVFIIDDLTTYGRGLANEFEMAAKGLGFLVLGHEGITQGEKDFTPLLTKIKALAPDLIYFAGMFPEAAVLIRQRFDLQIPAKFLAGDGVYEPTLITLATPAAAEGIYVTALGADIHTVPTAARFVEAYERRYGRLGAYSAYAYEATRLAVTAIRAAGTGDRAAVLAAMRSRPAAEGILGVHRFDEQGDTTLRTIGIFTVRDGRFQFLEAVDSAD
ncbi:MAG: branched-chain amino acid ABC transporter substrate-binding protein [Candidatus Omnitrophica bacterium]|nr:branched-chain amino acid ABC transporter substrate-binding protein [Candidatus Omnitrophota bacterium]